MYISRWSLCITLLHMHHIQECIYELINIRMFSNTKYTVPYTIFLWDFKSQAVISTLIIFTIRHRYTSWACTSIVQFLLFFCQFFLFTFYNPPFFLLLCFFYYLKYIFHPISFSNTPGCLKSQKTKRQKNNWQNAV